MKDIFEDEDFEFLKGESDVAEDWLNEIQRGNF